VPTYSEEDLQCIADAIGKPLADILPYGNEFEAAATWYRINIPSAQRQGPAASELRRQKPTGDMKNMKPSERRKLRSEKPRTFSNCAKKGPRWKPPLGSEDRLKPLVRVRRGWATDHQ
jgi:hypothetical protein